jgi:hypothetical protein
VVSVLAEKAFRYDWHLGLWRLHVAAVLPKRPAGALADGY